MIDNHKKHYILTVVFISSLGYVSGLPKNTPSILITGADKKQF